MPAQYLEGRKLSTGAPETQCGPPLAALQRYQNTLLMPGSGASASSPEYRVTSSNQSLLVLVFRTVRTTPVAAV